MSERKTAAEWHAKLDEIIKHDPDIDSDYAVGLMADLSAVEAESKENYDQAVVNMDRALKAEAEWDEYKKLAIGGDGTTHWYYKDQWQAERTRAEKSETERDDLRAYFDFTMGSPELSDDEVKALIARIEAARRSK